VYIITHCITPTKGFEVPLPELLTESEAARVLRLHPRTLRKARSSGSLTHIRLGRSIRYTIADLNAFLAAATVANDVEPLPTRRSSLAARKPAAVRTFTERQR
jgi:excisionase family DNA binding protein